MESRSGEFSKSFFGFRLRVFKILRQNHRLQAVFAAVLSRNLLFTLVSNSQGTRSEYLAEVNKVYPSRYFLSFYFCLDFPQPPNIFSFELSTVKTYYWRSFVTHNTVPLKDI